MPDSPQARLARSAGVDRTALAREVATRRRTLASALHRDGVEALVVASEANALYLTGYETTFWGNKSKPFVVVFAPPARPTVICHAGEEVSVRLDAIDVEVAPYVGPEVLPVPDGVQIDYQLPAADALLAHLRRIGARRVGMELSWHFIPGFTPLALDRVREGVPGEVVDASPALWRARGVKSAWEVDQMRLAADVAETAHRAFADSARVGMTERELNRLLRMLAYEAGAESIGYSGIIAGVDRAPLGGPTDRRWERGQLLFADLCPKVNGYFADFNRVYASASPGAEQERAYAGVVDALRAGCEAARAGTPVGALADAMIGGSPSFYARVGHGLGLEMPEPPSLSPQDRTALAGGTVLCLEPNREIAGVGWLVSEETVVVTDGGPQPISPPFPAELSVIG
jgi:Xaa-Pro aminopeptidase